MSILRMFVPFVARFMCLFVAPLYKLFMNLLRPLYEWRRKLVS